MFASKEMLIISFLALSLKLTRGTISTNNNCDYIGVYDDTNTYSMFEAKEYCMVNYGSSLASIHSDNDSISVENARLIGHKC